MQDFAGKVAVVTGGASGIGLGLARACVANGMKVVIGDVETAALDDAVRDLRAAAGAGDVDVDVRGVTTDVTDPDQMDALARAAVDAHGAVHLFFNNAGVGGGGLTWEAPLETWRWVLGVNLFGVIHGIRSFVPLLLQQPEAHIVNTASMAGLAAMPFMGAYNASKHAVVGIAETLYHEMTMMGGTVGVSVLCPGWVATRIADSERNRPAELSVEADPATAPMLDALRATLAEGMSTAEVADKVFAAIRERRFWILTHDGDEWIQAVESRLHSLVERVNPVIDLSAFLASPGAPG